MKIDDADVLSSSLQNIARNAAQNGVAVRSKSDPSSIPASGDAIDLNCQSRIFADAATAGESARAARIDQLRQMYVANQHTVDSQDLSGAILDSHVAGL